MNEREQKVYNETRLRNLKRAYSKLIQHGELTEEALRMKKEIETLSAMT